MTLKLNGKFFRKILSKIDNWVWWLKYRFHPAHRYHIVDSGLPPGYVDPDELILHVCMNILKQFVETAETKQSDEILAIYDWWVHDFPNREGQLPELPPSDNVKFPWYNDFGPEDMAWHNAALEREEVYARWTKEEQEMLIRLMKCRKALWYP